MTPDRQRLVNNLAFYTGALITAKVDDHQRYTFILKELRHCILSAIADDERRAIIHDPAEDDPDADDAL